MKLFLYILGILIVYLLWEKYQAKKTKEGYSLYSNPHCIRAASFPCFARKGNHYVGLQRRDILELTKKYNMTEAELNSVYVFPHCSCKRGANNQPRVIPSMDGTRTHIAFIPARFRRERHSRW